MVDRRDSYVPGARLFNLGERYIIPIERRIRSIQQEELNGGARCFLRRGCFESDAIPFPISGDAVTVVGLPGPPARGTTPIETRPYLQGLVIQALRAIM